MSLFTLIAERDRAAGRPVDLAIVGTAKNVGKTTTLNYLLERLPPSGLTSVGRDGEEYDAVTDLPKPRVRPPVGTLVATARTAALRSGTALAQVAPTPFRTAMGDLAIYRVASQAPIEVAGPVTVADARALLELLHEQGASRVLVDGAIDRKAAASPAVVGGVILATGLAMLDEGGGRLGGQAHHDRMASGRVRTVVSDQPPASPAERIAEVVRRTAAIVRMLGLPAIAPSTWRSQPLSDTGTISRTGALLDDGSFVAWPDGSTLDKGRQLAAWLPARTSALLLAGALTEDVAEPLLRAGRPGFTLVVPDGTHVLCQPRTFDRLLGRGIACQAARPVHLLAVTCNPTAPHRPAVEAADLLAALRAELSVPVYDLVSQP